MVLIIGGGVGGLSAAYYLLKNGTTNVSISEASNRLGGWIKTIKSKKTGVIFEMGPRTIRPSGVQGVNTLSLIEQLNLTDKVISIPSTHPTAMNKYIYIDNKLHILPLNLKVLFRKVPPFSKPLIYSLYKDFFTSPKKCSDDSLHNFVSRRLGEDVANCIVSPIICGICAGDSKEISVKFLLPHLFEAEQKHGSIIKGMYKTNFFKNVSASQSHNEISCGLSRRAKIEKWSVWMLQDGLETLTNALSENIKTGGAEIKLNSPCTEIKFLNNRISCKIGDEQIETTHVLCSLPANVLASLLRDQHKMLADELSSIEYVTVGVVNLVYDGEVLKENGFGFLVPPSQRLPILGVIFDSCSNKISGKTVLTVMMGGKWFNEYFGEKPTDEFLLNIAVSHVKNILNIGSNPVDYNVVTLKDCIPQYTIGHYDKINRIFSYIKENKLPLSLCGSCYSGVSLNDVILSSKNAVDDFIKLK